jgi:hypothetical protein
MMPVNYPYRFDGRGRTAQSRGNDYVKDLIEQVLFTAPGERVNRPDFGSGLNQLVFEPLGDEMAATVQFTVRGALEHWLSEVIRVEDLSVTREDSRLTVTLTYLVLQTGERKIDRFSREAPL